MMHKRFPLAANLAQYSPFAFFIVHIESMMLAPGGMLFLSTTSQTPFLMMHSCSQSTEACQFILSVEAIASSKLNTFSLFVLSMPLPIPAPTQPNSFSSNNSLRAK